MGKLQPYYPKEELFKIIGYKPNKGQQEFHDSPARFKTLRCGRRAGKTTGGPMEVIDLICTPGSRGWIVAPDYRLGEKEFRVVWDAIFGGQLFPDTKLKHLVHGRPLKKAFNTTQGQMHLSIIWKFDDAIVYPNRELTPLPSEILVLSGGSEASLVGDELDWIIMAEVGKLENSLAIWNRYLRMTLASRRARAIFPSTSYGGKSELLTMMFDLGQDPRNTNYESWQWPSYINPFWAADEDEELEDLKNLTEEEYAEQILGNEGNYAGRFYKTFTIDNHITDLVLDPVSTMYRSWDFGYRHPCIGWFQKNKRDQVCWLWTYLGTDLDDIDLAYIGKYLTGEIDVKFIPLNVQEIIAREKLFPFVPYGEVLDIVDVCDAAGTQQKSSADSAINVLHSQNIYPRYTAEKTRNSEKEPESIGIARNLLKIRNNGEPNLLVDKYNFIAKNMFLNLSYEEKRDGIPTHKFKRDGLHEHSADVFKYFCLNVMRYSLYTDKKQNQLSRELISYV
ncbi:MAG: hypothetical protein ABIB11_00600 [Candidatus Omnitrophota bacterium]